MRRGIPVRFRKSQWIIIFLTALLLSFIMTAAIQLFKSAPVSPTNTQPIEQEKIPPPGTTQANSKIAPSLDNKTEARSLPAAGPAPEQEHQEARLELVTGKVSIINPQGAVVSDFTAPVINGSWLALPTRACIGGNTWTFQVNDERPVPIRGGLWSKGDPVGLWELAGDIRYPGPSLATWQQEAAIRFFSFETDQLSAPIRLTPLAVQGEFIYCGFEGNGEPGIFLQDGKVVGWAFGEQLPGAYMWPLGRGEDLLYQNYVDDFYNTTFAGGREEYFSLALAMGKDAPPRQQLQMFAEGFWVQPKLSSPDTPAHLAPENVYPYIINLTNILMDQGAFQYVASLSEEPMLWEIKDDELMNNVIRAIEKSYGIEGALNFVEGQLTDMQQVLNWEEDQFQQLHLALYEKWIKTLLDNNEIARGWEIYNRAVRFFAKSPKLNLLAVELALAEQDWTEAERLLYSMEYPQELREMRMLLADRISDIKGQENKIVLRFQPGSQEIPVTATINEQFDQEFLIDTGATFVTIPSSTVAGLDLEDGVSQNQQEIQTAGGPILANSVTLSSVELQGWMVYDVKALVIDLPNRPGVGLLGLNFLNRFRMDLQTADGLLTLAPK